MARNANERCIYALADYTVERTTKSCPERSPGIA